MSQEEPVDAPWVLALPFVMLIVAVLSLAAFCDPPDHRAAKRVMLEPFGQANVVLLCRVEKCESTTLGTVCRVVEECERRERGRR